MTAFAAAVALGLRYLETDVRVTADGVALAFHDAALNRLTEHSGKVAELPWSLVSRARIRGTEPIPLLADVLAAWPDTFVNLDIKSDAGIGPTIDAIRRTRTRERVCVGAFSTRRIEAVRQVLGPSLCTSLGPRAALRLRLARPSRAGRDALAGRCAQVPARIGRRVFVDEQYLATAHELGLPVHAWTVNDPAEMVRLLELGVDGIMTDRADVLRDLLVARGQWPDTLPSTSKL